MTASDPKQQLSFEESCRSTQVGGTPPPLGPAPPRNACHRLRSQALSQQHRASAQALIAQAERVKFVGDPAHGCSVWPGGGRTVTDDEVGWNGMGSPMVTL